MPALPPRPRRPPRSRNPGPPVEHGRPQTPELNPRNIIVAAVAFLASHAVVLAIWGHQQPGPLLSSFLQLGMGILIVATTVSAARRAGGDFERRFLLLVAARYVIFTIAQAIATYHERDVAWEFEGSIPDIL